MRSEVRSLRLCATGALAMVSGLITAATFLSPSAGPVRWGVWLAAGLALPSYWTLSLALRGSNGFFFGVFLGGILGRLAGMAAGIVAAWRFDPSTVALFALSAAGALAGLSIIEVYFIGRQNRLPQ